MGQRVAEMKTPGCGDVEGYCVYQSTAMACFSPIFRNQLAAELFASTLPSIYPNWSDADQMELASRVNTYIRTCFGEEPEDHAAYNDHLCDDEAMSTLRTQFLSGWPKAVKP
jgi:hypothetical protein